MDHSAGVVDTVAPRVPSPQAQAGAAVRSRPLRTEKDETMSNFPHDVCAKGHAVQQGENRQRCRVCQNEYTRTYRAKLAAKKKPRKKR
jgi:hypothetical protein